MWRAKEEKERGERKEGRKEGRKEEKRKNDRTERKMSWHRQARECTLFLSFNRLHPDPDPDPDNPESNTTLRPPQSSHPRAPRQRNVCRVVKGYKD